MVNKDLILVATSFIVFSVGFIVIGIVVAFLVRKLVYTEGASKNNGKLFVKQRITLSVL